METTLKKPAAITDIQIDTLVEKGIAPEIAAIDLSMVKMKMQDPNEGLGWSVEQCESAEVEYKRFLHMNYRFKGEGIVPNKIMDSVWHYHILDTRAYCNDSQRVFGGYFHHFPYFGMRGEQDKQNLINSFKSTQLIYEKEFGEPMIREEHSDCWHDCEGRCWHACSNDDNLR